MAMFNVTRAFVCTSLINIIWLAFTPAVAAPLTGSGAHLPIPTNNPSWPPGVSVARVDLGGSFTGTWSSPVIPDWVGTFHATGPIPASSVSGTTKYDFSSLPLGYLPAGTFFIFGDVDSGPTLAERTDLKGFDSNGNIVSAPWLDSTYAVNGSGTGMGGTLVGNDLPGWSWNDPTNPSTYVIDGSTVNSGNPNVAFALISNQPLYGMELNKHTTHNGFILQAPVIPEPSAVALIALGSLGIVALRKPK